MSVLATLMIAALGLLHVGIMALEMWGWTTPRGRKAFGMTREFAESTATLGANQGLYNGFLAAGLLWGAFGGDFGVRLFFLACVAIAGVFGAVTVHRRIALIQTLPAVLCLVAALLAR